MFSLIMYNKFVYLYLLLKYALPLRFSNFICPRFYCSDLFLFYVFFVAGFCTVLCTSSQCLHTHTLGVALEYFCMCVFFSLSSVSLFVTYFIEIEAVYRDKNCLQTSPRTVRVRHIRKINHFHGCFFFFFLFRSFLGTICNGVAGK